MRYFWLIWRHKWFVFLAGLRTGAPIWRLVVHDWTKFLPSELPHYQRQFFGKADDPAGFIACWIHHQNHNPHHWEYWVPRTGHTRCVPPYPDNEPIPMPEWACREMVADWMGASRAYEGRRPSAGNWPWLEKNWPGVARRAHPWTRERLLTILLECGLRPPIQDAVWLREGER